jgi:hypothetical protein
MMLGMDMYGHTCKEMKLQTMAMSKRTILQTYFWGLRMLKFRCGFVLLLWMFARNANPAPHSFRSPLTHAENCLRSLLVSTAFRVPFIHVNREWAHVSWN